MRKTTQILISLIILLGLITPAMTTYSAKSIHRLQPLEQYSDQEQKINAIISLINESVIETFLQDLVAIGPRMTGTYGCEKAGEFINDCFTSFGLQTNIYQWSDWGNRWHPGYFHSENIEGIHATEGMDSEEIIVFNAHYDTVEDTVGANDDGSGVVGVLAAAYALSQFEFKRPIHFVTFSGEEIGLLGSEHYVKQLYENNMDVLVEVNADMIGLANTREQGQSIRLSYSEDTPWIIDHIININNSHQQFHLDITGTYPYDRTANGGGSDYYHFIKYGYESISFWQATPDPNMHTPQDDLSNVNISYLVNTTRLIASTIASIADETSRPVKVTIASPEKGALYFRGRLKKQYDDQHTMIIDNKWVYLDLDCFDAGIQKVEFYIDDDLMYTTTSIPHVWNMNFFSFGAHTLTVIAYDTMGRTSTDMIEFTMFNPIRSN